MTAGGPVAGATGGGLRFEYEIDWRLCARCMRAGGLWPGSGHSVYGCLNHGQRHQPTGAEPDADSAAADSAAADSAAADSAAADSAAAEPAAAEPAAAEPAAHQRHRDALLAGAHHRYRRRPAHRP